MDIRRVYVKESAENKCQSELLELFDWQKHAEAMGVYGPFAKVFSDMFNAFSYHEGEIKRKEEIGSYAEIMKKDPSFHFVPNYLDLTIQQLFVAFHLLSVRGDKLYDANILDAGCGPGNILSIMDSIISTYEGGSWNPASIKARFRGLEISDESISLGKKLFDIKGRDYNDDEMCVGIKKQDILTFKHYGAYDLIYYYCPIQLTPLECLFEEIVEDSMKVGAYLAPNLKRSRIFLYDERFRHISVRVNGIGCTNITLIQKIKDGPRKSTYLQKHTVLTGFPEKYQDIGLKHIKGLKFRRQ